MAVSPRDRILAHQNATYGDVRGRRPDTPPNLTRAIIKSCKDKPSGLMGGCFGQDGNRKTSNANGMQHDGSIVQKTKNVNTERIYNAVRDQHRGVYANGFGRGRCVRCPDGGGDGDEISQSKGNSGGDRYLAQQVEPEDVRF